MTDISKRLRQLRTEHNYTGGVLAEKLGKTPGYISRIESKEIPSPVLLLRIAELYGVDPEELFELARQGCLERARKAIAARYPSLNKGFVSP